MDVRATIEPPPPPAPTRSRSASSRARASRTTCPDGELGALLESGEARTGFRKLALTHADGRRWLVAGLGKREDFDPERARIAAATALGRARELGARRCAGSSRTTSPTRTPPRSSTAR